MTPFRFLHLPAEVRNNIYRLLLCQPTTIQAIRPIVYLHPAVLRVNHQVHDEAEVILYGENYFGMNINDQYDDQSAYFDRCNYFIKDVDREPRQFRLIQRYDICIRLGCEEEILMAKKKVRKVCQALSEVPRIKHLIITLEGFLDHRPGIVAAFERLEPQVEDQNATPLFSRSPASLIDSNDIIELSSGYVGRNFKLSLGTSNGVIELSFIAFMGFIECSLEEPTEIICLGLFGPSSNEKLDELPIKEWVVERIEFISRRVIALRPFTLLRNVGRVDVHGAVKSRFKKGLIDVMQGCSPLNNLSRMYDALDCFVKPFDCCYEELDNAYEAMVDENVELFKRVREEVVEKVTAVCMARIADAKERLFDYDAPTDT
jgi:hypothetical protein